MKTLFTPELLAKLRQREKEIAEGKGITITRPNELPSQLKRYAQESKRSVREKPTNAAASDDGAAA
jgi:hypothetical protein